eukprot:CAMPEP_0198202174 /NCGR_PEP_ID=MMETSP1445-20131203/5282_1 /TAXON_ID=36898 /ORGANISM="Pyramimonas sp., Strain CCMP2087" /LENGTH=391 /DNA_ID=CAMNT_0043872963 /DNA_START=116 /DNA_END=1287 /DNA_ORIENTATION=-
MSSSNWPDFKTVLATGVVAAGVTFAVLKTKQKHPSGDADPEAAALADITRLADQFGLDVAGGVVRRSSSRFCLGVEHGDYNGTELFGVGTDRYIWVGYKPNASKRVRLYSANFPGDGVIEFEVGKVPPPLSKEVADSWARFPYGVDYILNQNGLKTQQGFDAVVVGNIPGGGMSRSASLTLNLLLTMLELNHLTLKEDFQTIELSQAVENIYIGSPCGQLDQIMIYYAKEGMGTHYNPATKSIKHVPLGAGGRDLRVVSLDTGTVRPGLEKSTYVVRREECDTFAKVLWQDGFEVRCLGDVKDEATFQKVKAKFGADSDGGNAAMCERLDYIYHAQRRFYEMMAAWTSGDIAAVGRIFRQDGHGLRDAYKISGPELETMCDIVRTVPGVLG